MILQVYMETPDAVNQAILNEIGPEPQDEELWEAWQAKKVKAEKFLDKFFDYGESVTLEFDIENQTAKVL